MKKNIKLKIILVAASFILLQTQVLADPIVVAINQLRTDTINAINGSANTSILNQIIGLNTQVTKLFDDTFKGTFTNNILTSPSTLDDKVTFYTNKFYSLYTTKDFPSLGFKEISEKNNDSVQKLLTQEIGYNTQRSIDKKIGDMGMLLSQPIEKDNNNITAENLGINSNDKTTITPYGSLDSSLSPVASNTPTVNDLIGPDTYDETTSNKAKLFISYILRTSLPPKTFYIPSENEAVGIGENGAVSVYLPIPSTDDPYTTVSVSTYKDISGQSQYTRMVDYLNTNAKYYQPYKMKTRATNILRTLYIENLFNLYQERTKEKIMKDGKETEGSKSLVEKEKDEAFAGLDKKYYDDLKTKSAADVNLEMLRAINKLSYFVYKLHQDNERSTLIMAASGLQLAGQNSQDDSAYVNPISTLIKNKCWAPTEATQGICDNPSNPSMTQR